MANVSFGNELVGTLVAERYRLRRLLGAGPAATSYLADRISGGVVLGSVVVRLCRGVDEGVRTDLERIAALSEPSLTLPTEHGRIDDPPGAYYLARAYAARTLADVLGDGAVLSSAEAEVLARAGLAALDALRAAGVAHRNVCPENVLWTAEGWRLADAGLRTGMWVGEGEEAQGLDLAPYHLMRLRGEGPGPAGDLWALGVTLRECLLGRLPQHGVGTGFLTRALAREREERYRDLPEPWPARLLALLSEDPAQRALALKRAEPAAAEPPAPPVGSGPISPEAQPPASTPAESAPPRGTVRPAPLRGELTVAKDGTGDFASVAEAVALAAPGSRIVVKPGVYTEGVTLSSAMELVGDGPRGEIVLECRDPKSNCLHVTAGDAVLRNLAFRMRSGPDSGRSAVWVRGGRPAFHDCQFTSASGPCVTIEETDTSPFFRGCEIHGGRVNGVVVARRARGTFEECEIHGNGSSGVGVKSGANPVFRKCVIRDGQRGGVVVIDGGRGEFVSCEIVRNGGAGVGVGKGGEPIFRHCRIHQNKEDGVCVLDGGGGYFERCDLRRNQWGPWKIAPGCRVVRKDNVE